MRARITRAALAALPPQSELHDTALAGFGARRQRGAAVTFFALYRDAEGRQRRVTIGRTGVWSPRRARREARRLLGEAAAGADPAAARQAARHAPSVADLVESYLADARAGRVLTVAGRPKAPATLAADARRLARHVLPAIGRRRVAAVSVSDIEALRDGIMTSVAARARPPHAARAGASAARRVLGTLGAVFAYAVRRRLRADNPVRGVIRPADAIGRRRFADQEYAALGAALRRHGGHVGAASCIEFLAITGWRPGEAVALREADLDRPRRLAHLSTSKTGASTRVLPLAALALLTEAAGFGAEGFAATELRRPFAAIARRAGLPAELTPRTLRRSHASVAAELGTPLPVIAALLGHRAGGITAAYVVHDVERLREAADRVAAEVLRRMHTAAKPTLSIESKT